MTELKTRPSSTHLRTPKAKRKLGLFVPTVRLPHEYLIQSHHSDLNLLPDRLAPDLPLDSPNATQPHKTESGIPEKGVPHSANPSVVEELRIPETGVPETGIPESGTPPLSIAPRTPRIRRAILAQDGHSLGEQALYEALWQAARPHSAQARIITIGYRGMTEIARLTANNCKANIQSLTHKLAVEEISSYTHAHARTYLIYSFPAILERRKAAGFTHYIKSRGILFVDPESGNPLTPSRTHRGRRDTPEPGLPPSGIPESGTPFSPPTPQRIKSGIPVSGDSGTPDSGTLNTRNQNLEITTSSSSAAEFPLTRQALTDFPDIHPSDHDILDLVERCIAVCADTQDAEIADFVRLKGSTLKTESIRTSRMALLLKIVPLCLMGDTLKLHRKRKREEFQAQQAQEGKMQEELEAMDRFWEETLRDPQRSAENRKNAMGYFLGVLERADSTPERRKRAEDTIKQFREKPGQREEDASGQQVESQTSEVKNG
jgi:hypothetical protein